MLTESENLVRQLSQQEKEFDQLFTKALTIKNQIKAMKDYNKDLLEFSKINKSKNESSFHKRIILESLYIKRLRKENGYLKESIEEHKSILELVMQKYRTQVAKLMVSNQVNELKYDPIEHCKKVDKLALKVEEMARVMCKAISMDEAQDFDHTQKLHILSDENRELRQILRSFPLLASPPTHKLKKHTTTPPTNVIVNDNDDQQSSTLKIENTSTQAPQT